MVTPHPPIGKFRTKIVTLCRNDWLFKAQNRVFRTKLGSLGRRLELAIQYQIMQFHSDMRLCVSDIRICAYIFQIRINQNMIYVVYANVRMCAYFFQIQISYSDYIKKLWFFDPFPNKNSRLPESFPSPWTYFPLTSSLAWFFLLLTPNDIPALFFRSSIKHSIKRQPLQSYIEMLELESQIFIGPSSDHSLRLSGTH